MASREEPEHIQVEVEREEPAPRAGACPREAASEHLPGLQVALSRRRAARPLRVCTVCGHHFPVGAEERVEQLADPGSFRPSRRGRALGRSARVRRPAPLHGAPQRGRGGDRASATRWSSAPRRSRACRACSARWTSPSWAARWAASSARCSRAPATWRPSAASRCLGRGLGRRAHAGERARAHADGRRPSARRPAARVRRAVRLRARPPDDRRRDRVASPRSATSSIAEPDALLSFAGPRVVQEDRRARRCREDFGRAESSLEHGLIDAVIKRPDLKDSLGRILACAPAARSCRSTSTPRSRRRLASWPACSVPALAPARRRRIRTEVRREQPPARRRSAGCAAASPSARPSRTSGMPSSSPATTGGPTRWITRIVSWTTGSSCTATAPAPTTPRSSRASAPSAAARSRSSATRRAATSRSAPSATSAWRSPGLRQGAARVRARRPPRLSCRDDDRHAGRVSGRRGRAGRPGRRHRAVMSRWCACAVPIVVMRDRRGRIGRSARDRRRRSRAHARARDLLGDLARGLRDDPLAGR